MAETLVEQPLVPAGRVAVQIVDADVHTHLLTPALVDHLQEPWKSRLARRPPPPLHTYYFPPDAANGGGMRMDSYPPGGGRPGSDPDFAFEQLIREAGVDIGILEPFGPYEIDPEAEHAQRTATNDYLAEVWLDRHNAYGRWYGTISVSNRAPAAGAREIERWVGHPHMVGVLITPQVPFQFSDPSMDPIYDAASRHGLPVTTHLMSLSPYELTPIFPVGNALHFHDLMAGWPLLFATHVMSLVFDGTFERFPHLRVVFVEGAFTWALPIMWRMDRIWEARRADLPHVRRRPSEYVREHIRFTTQPLEDPEQPGDYAKYLEWMDIGDLVMFSTDYPHWSFDNPSWAIKQFPKATRERIMRLNALELYGLPSTVPAMAP
jgi:predicted TIM-barrel fold metal-dependent hydrolase